MKINYVFLVAGHLCFFWCVEANWKAYATVPQLVRSAGYPIQKYNVFTTDSYILQIYRIPNGLGGNKTGDMKKVVLLVHGIFCSCDNFIMMGPNKSIAFFLADAGYDVWIGNLRGNLYTSHKHLTRLDPTFWDYSIEEHGKYDAPAIIDKILKETGQPRLMYIGHSMGCTTLLTMLAQHPEYNDKLVAFVGLAPAAYMDNLKGFCSFVVNNLDLPTYLDTKNIRGLAAPRMLLEKISDYCAAQQLDKSICMKILNAFVGEDNEQLFTDFQKVFLMRVQPVSTRQLFHFMKISITGVFTYWEDGFGGRVRPYNLTNIRIPVSLWYGPNDQLTEKTQIQRLARELNDTGTLYSIKPVPWDKFTHIDFLYARDIAQLLNIPLMAEINQLFVKYNKR